MVAKRLRRGFDSRGNRTSAKRSRRSRPRRLLLESLEARQMLSVTPDLQLVSHAADLSTSANGVSFIDQSYNQETAISQNGRYVAFTSTATNLVSGYNLSPGGLNVYRYDRVTGHVDLVSVSSAGTDAGNGDSFDPVISADGSVVAFTSFAGNLSPLDNNGGIEDVFARNFNTNTTTLVSVNAAGTGGGNSGSGLPVISANGAVVAFASVASNLSPLDTNGFVQDIFTRNLVTNATSLVSANAVGNGSGDGASYDPVISADGTVVAFDSNAGNLTSVATGDAFLNVFSRNLSTNTTRLISVNASGTGGGNSDSGLPVISADGNVIAYVSFASNLDSTKTTSTYEDVFAQNLTTNTTSLVSRDPFYATSNGNSGNGNSFTPTVNADGSVIAFASNAGDLIYGSSTWVNGGRVNTSDNNGLTDIFVRYVNANSTVLASVNSAGTGSGNGASIAPAISADGTVVTFLSDAADLQGSVPFTYGVRSVYARNMGASSTDLVSVNASGTGNGNQTSFSPVISADGSVVAFTSNASNLAGGDFNNSADVFLANLPASISGFIYEDANDNGLKDAGEQGLPYKRLTLTGTDDLGSPVTQTVSTDFAGAYGFWNLRPGIYSVALSVDGYHLDGLKSINNVPIPGSATTDVTQGSQVTINGIQVSADQRSPNNNFGQLRAASLSGFVYVDANNNGLREPGEPPLSGVTLTLTGTDDLGQIAAMSTITGDNGGYSFGNLRPGNYTVSETQPIGYLDGLDAKNNVPIPGSNTTDAISGIQSVQGADSGNNNFGEMPRLVQRGDFASIGFWKNKNGQALINSLNGGPDSTALARWLTANFENLYGPGGDYSYSGISPSPFYMETVSVGTEPDGPPILLTKFTNAQVAASFLSNYFTTGSGAKTNAQILAAALAVYVTNPNLAGGDYAAKYGFNLVGGGSGNDFTNVGAYGAAFGVPNNTTMTVFQMLKAVDFRSGAGVVYPGNPQLASMANSAFDMQVNSVGNISLVTADAATSGVAAPLIDTLHPLVGGVVVVAVDALPGDATQVAEEQARVNDAVASLNATLAPEGVTIDEIQGDDGVPADVHVHFADTSVIGGVGQGVLGVTEAGGEITIVNGWNFYFGSDPSAVGSDQYDFQTVITHELGHSLGLGHSTDTSSVMFPYLGTAEARRSLTANDMQILDTDSGTAPEPLMAAASPTLTTTASFAAGNVVGSAIPQDSAVLSGGNQESGPLTFTLVAPDNSVVDTETVQVNGDGTYQTSNANVTTQVGTYTWQASYAGDPLNNSASDQGGAAEQLTTVKASLTLVSTASFAAGNVVGSAIPQDSAVLSGGYQESGPITFTLIAPDNSVVDTETVQANGDGTYQTSNVNLATQLGTYIWRASYAGDGLNNPAPDQGGAAEQLTTIKASPAISTTASETAGGLVGSAVLSDSAAIFGGDNPTGTITFSLTAPTGTTTTVGTVIVAGAGAYNAPTVLATQVGTYTWHATYSGDGVNKGAADNGSNESLTTINASPTITTVASAGGAVGSTSVYDTATLSGGYNESGNIVFILYDSTNTAVFASTKPAPGNGSVMSGSFAPTSAGTYRWSAVYAGDANNNGASDNGVNESVTMTWASPLPAGSWTPLAHTAPGGIGTMELLTDGTVMALSGDNYYKLTPDSTGSYVNGTWSQLASPNLQRLYDATNVLTDGRVFVLGGEYTGPNNTGSWANTGEIYNPVTNSWSNIPNYPFDSFGDDPSMLLSDGRVLTANIDGPSTFIYDPTANTWSSGPTKLYNDRSDEETWVKLSDGSILQYDIWGNTQEAQRLDTSTMTWVDAGHVPVALDNGGEIGPGLLLPDGRVFQIGGTSNTALYTPPTTPRGTGSWAAGPVIPGGFVANDAPAAMLVNGDVLFAAGSGNNTHLFEFDPSANSITDVTPTNPNLSGTVAFVNRMLALPSGQALFTSSNSQLYIYTPSGSPQAAWKPAITSVTPKGSNYTLTGTQLNGISAGASYGDDAEMDTNYPIIELKNGSGQVYFARTFNWGTGVATGSAQVSTDFSLPAKLPYGTYSLTVVANGIASPPVNFTGGIVGTSADLVVTNNGPTATSEGTNGTYNLVVTNNGPSTATNVVLTDTLDPNLKYISATSGQGTFSQSGSVVTFTIGTVAVGQTVTATVMAESTGTGRLINTASATSSVSDANSNNNTCLAADVVSDPGISVSAPITTTSTTLSNFALATFTHANGVEPSSAFLATIMWGDGSTSLGTISVSGSTYTVKGSHTYAQGGTYTITTSVQPTPSGAWSRVGLLAPTGSLSTMELLTDGSVMVFTSTAPNNVYKLTPDATGSYANGTWSQLANMNLARVGFATNVLPDGRVLVLGGANTGANLDATYTNTGEIYDPVANAWTNIAPFPEANFGNDPTAMLPDGRVIAGSKVGPQTYIYNPATNTWTAGPTRLFNEPSWSESWTQLPDGSIFSIGIWNNAGEAQRLDPNTMTWIDSGTPPTTLQVPGRALGPAVLLADGRLLQLGGLGSINGNANTAIYTPATNPGGTGTWAAGPMIPADLGTRMSSATLLPSGHVLFAAGPASPRLFEFDPAAPLATSLTDVTPANPDLSGQTTSATRMLNLPSGQILIAGAPTAGELDLYTPSGSPQAAWKPTITSIVPKGSNYTLTGTQLNGFSGGASFNYGAEMASNYPIVELTNGAGKVYFARTFNHSSTGVATGNTPLSTDFSLPANLPSGTYSLNVVANGIASAPVSFTGGYTNEADLAVTEVWPTTSSEGSNIIYNLTVTNNGPTSATNVVLTDTLGANLNYVSASQSQGTSSQSGGKVTISIGTVAVGQTVTATVTAQAAEDGTLTNTASVTSSLSDANLSNNTVVATTAASEPAISVSGPVFASGKKQNNVTVATFTHANGVEPASAFVATIDWGDGTTSAGTISLSGTTYSVKGSHSYATNGVYTVTTTVTEPTGSGGTPSPGPGTGPGTPPATHRAPSKSEGPDKNSELDRIFADAEGTIRGGSNDWLAAPSNDWHWAGAQPIADTDNLDAFFELLEGSRSNALV